MTPRPRPSPWRISLLVEAPDLGTETRLARGDLIVVGSGRNARARVFSVVLRWPEECRDAAAWLLGLFEVARYQGYKCAVFELRSAGGGAAEITGRAVGARRALNRVASVLGAELWGSVWFLLFWEESSTLYAIRAGIGRGVAHRRLRKALELVADQRRRGWL